MVVVIAKRTVKPDRKEEYLKLTAKLVSETRKEKGCISYDFCESNTDSMEIALVEKWENEETLGVHFETAHFKEYMAKASDLLSQKKPIEVYKVVL